jgi:hypothetical protein
MVPPSHPRGFERCRLLCDTVDRLVTGAAHRFLLVERRAVALLYLASALLTYTALRRPAKPI